MRKLLLSASFVMMSFSLAFSSTTFQDDKLDLSPKKLRDHACFDAGDLTLTPIRSGVDDAQSYSAGHAPQKEANTDIILLLPGELVVQIVATLSGTDIIQLGATCRHLNQLLQDDVFWHPLIRAIRADFEPGAVDSKSALEIYKIHCLKVWATTLEDPELIETFIQQHHLCQFPTFFLGRFFFNHRYFEHFDRGKFISIIGPQEHARIEHQLQNLSATPSAVPSESEQIIIYRQINGLIDGIYGYEKDLTRACTLVELRCQQGDWHAIDLKIKGSIYGCHGYTKPPHDVHDLIEQWSAQGHPLAIKVKIWGLNEGCYGYDKDLEHLRHFIDDWSKQGYRTAFDRKIGGLLYGIYGYTQDVREAHHLIDTGIRYGQMQAIYLKLKGLISGEYGYTEDPADVRRFIDHWSAQGNREAMYRKMEGLMYGDHGYVQNLQELHDLIEQWSAQGYSEFIDKKIAGLIDGKYGYSQDLEAAGRFIMTLPAQAARNIIEHVLYENFRFVDFSHLNNFIDVLHHQGQRYATYLKAFFLKFQLNPRQETPHAARDFILRHRIAF